MKNIVLVGFMGTGKTIVGRALAEWLGMEFVELDAEVEAEEGISIKEIFERYGEPYFRDLETEIVKRFSQKEGLVISTGGGVVLREENMKALREKGIIVCLWAEPETILERTSGNNERPLLNVDDPLNRIKELLQQRRPFYERADIMIKTDSKDLDTVVNEIIEKLKEKGL
ncbi:MAG: shikimate kinase [Nitrospirae bacterium]|nr:shikimate kinase [Nitrospirota bacterium]